MAMDIHEETNLRLTRRTFLGKTVRGIGSLALGSLLTPSLLNAATEIERWPGIISEPHVPPKAKTDYSSLYGRRSHHIWRLWITNRNSQNCTGNRCPNPSPKDNRSHSSKDKRTPLNVSVLRMNSKNGANLVKR